MHRPGNINPLGEVSDISGIFLGLDLDTVAYSRDVPSGNVLLTCLRRKSRSQKRDWLGESARRVCSDVGEW